MALPTIVLDVNETLLDLSALDPLFADTFGDKGVRRIWFAQTLQLAMASTIYGTYAPFGELARAALQMTARKRGVTLDQERGRRIMRGFETLPAHGDVRGGLEKLREAGYRIVVLAQASEALLEAQLEYAGIRSFVERIFSADLVRRFKPAPQAYDLVTEAFHGERKPILITAHDWDASGAMHAGWEAAFVARHGTALNPLEPPPTFVAPDLRELATQLGERIDRRESG